MSRSPLLRRGSSRRPRRGGERPAREGELEVEPLEREEVPLLELVELEEPLLRDDSLPLLLLELDRGMAARLKAWRSAEEPGRCRGT